MLIVTVWVGARRLKFGRHFAQRHPADGLQHAVASVQGDQAAALPRLPRRPAAVANAPCCSRTVRGTVVELVPPLVLLFSHNHTVTVRRGRRDDRLPPVHHLDVPARGAAGVERAVHVHRGVPVPRLPQPGRLRRSRTWIPALLVADGRRAARSSRCSATCGRTWCRSCRRCASTPATGPRRMWAFAPGAEQQARQAARQGRPDAEATSSTDDVRRGRGRGDPAAAARLAGDAQPGPRAELGA